jgi:large subunit ribosomal protein L19
MSDQNDQKEQKQIDEVQKVPARSPGKPEVKGAEAKDGEGGDEFKAPEAPEEPEEVIEAPVVEEKKLPEFNAGDTVKVSYRIIEGSKTRTQPYTGIVIAKKGKGVSKTFTVRRIGADNIGVERIFALHSPNIEDIEIVKRGKVRRAKLYYLRDKKGRAAMRIKERVAKPSPKK